MNEQSQHLNEHETTHVVGDKLDAVARKRQLDPGYARTASLSAHRRQREIAKLMEQIFTRLREKL